MDFKCTGIVINHHKYTDSRVILNVFTRDLGKVAFVTSIGGKSRPRSLIQPCTILEIDFDFRENKDLQTFKSVNTPGFQLKIWSDMTKSAIGLFVAEVLQKSLPSSYPNKELYQHTLDLLMDMEDSKPVHMMPIRFLLHLIRDLGFEPTTAQVYNRETFDAESGEFVYTVNKLNPEEEENMRILHDILNANYPENFDLDIASSETRKFILNELLDYIRHRLDVRKAFKSHEILEVVLRG